MDTAPAKPEALNPHFTLSARQEELLFRALNSNKTSSLDTVFSQSNDSLTMAPGSFSESPVQAPGSGTLNGFEDSPFIDYDYEFDADGSYDYDFANDSQGQMIGKLPGTSSDGDADTHDKRSHPDDDGDDEEGGGKRREGGDEKSSKKPGRKPLTSEPTSKRKAQNRAAQRAFRERKEKHLKDLETKVDDLEKASESANHENSILRAQIEKMSMELREYRKRLSLNGNSARNSSLSSGLPSYLAGKGLGLNNPNDVNFQFEFPRFGRLPGPSPTNTSAILNGTRQSASPPTTVQQIPSPVERNQVSPLSQTLQQFPVTNGSTASLNPTLVDGGDMSSLSGLFSPSLLDSVSKSPQFEFFSNNGSNGSRSSSDSNGQMSTGHNTSYSSPSASSNSNHGPSSSCGTSPEPSMQSPIYGKADATLTTIGEESNGTSGEGNSETPAFDINGIDWFAQQNGNQFDPQLFGDYREPQENILSGDGFTDSFFADAFAVPDFNSSFNVAPSPVAPKKDLVTQIDEHQNDDDEVVPGEDPSQMLSCNTIWDRLQACPKVKEGEFDLDLLCKDLQKKAKCSETGAVVNESDFNKIMKSYIGNKGVAKTS